VDPDLILSRAREIAANATRATRSQGGCTDAQCVFRDRAQALAELFTALDESLSSGGLIPMAWAGGPDLPAPRRPIED
jgi:hypothetical protein